MSNDGMLNIFGNCITFLSGIGIFCSIGESAPNSFLPNVTIKNGGIIYTPEVIVSDLLHEAGHLACVPTKYRPLCQTDMDESLRRIWDKAKKNGEVGVDTPMYRALIQCDDCEATAWAWAVGKLLKIPEEQIIQDHQYEGGGADIRLMLSNKRYYGINGLCFAGMINSVRDFPNLTKFSQ